MATPRLRWGKGDIEDLDRLIGEYFDECEADGMPPCIPGLCIKLGITKDTWSYYTSNRYLAHTPSYIKDHDTDNEDCENRPTDDDLAAVDTFDWPKALPIAGSNLFLLSFSDAGFSDFQKIFS